MPTFQGRQRSRYNPKGFTVARRGWRQTQIQLWRHRRIRLPGGQDVATIYDLRTTILHVQDSIERLTFYHNGTERRLTVCMAK